MDIMVWNKLIFIDRLMPKKCHLGPQSSSRSLGPEKMPKMVNCVAIKETEKTKRNNGGFPSGIGGWIPISTRIINPNCMEQASIDQIVDTQVKGTR
jgi:hypothetical protein